MSRIDEALRRAADESTGTVSTDGDTVPQPVTGEDIAVLARESFAVAVAEPARNRSRPAADPSFTADQDAPPRRSRSLFDRIDRRLAEKVVLDQNMAPGSREQYRRLAAVLHDAQANDGVHVVMLASAVAGEGKTLTATNLALTLSESYHRRVLLIDADLRKPALHNVFKINSTAGLSEGLHPDGASKLIVRQISERLSLLPGGRPNSDPMASLTSDRMRKLVEEAKEAFDWVIIDTPPLVILPDANLLASMVDAAVLVVRAQSTPHHLVKRAVDAIGSKRILGVVLNQASAKDMPYGAYYESYYAGDAEGTD